MKDNILRQFTPKLLAQRTVSSTSTVKLCVEASLTNVVTYPACSLFKKKNGNKRKRRQHNPTLSGVYSSFAYRHPQQVAPSPAEIYSREEQPAHRGAVLQERRGLCPSSSGRKELRVEEYGCPEASAGYIFRDSRNGYGVARQALPKKERPHETKEKREEKKERER